MRLPVVSRQDPRQPGVGVRDGLPDQVGEQRLAEAVVEEAVAAAYVRLGDLVGYLESAGAQDHQLTRTLAGMVWAEEERRGKDKA